MLVIFVCLFLMAVAKIVFLCSEVTAVSTYFIKPIYERLGFSGGSDDKESTCNEGDLGSIPGLGKIPRRRAWQPTPGFLSGESPWTEEPGGLQSMGSQRVRHNWAMKHSTCMATMQGIQTYNAPSWSASLLVVYICIKKENCSLSMC